MSKSVSGSPLFRGLASEEQGWGGGPKSTRSETPQMAKIDTFRNTPNPKNVDSGMAEIDTFRNSINSEILIQEWPKSTISNQKC